MYENPDCFHDKEKQKKWCLKKALKLAEIKTTEEKPVEMSSEDIVAAAENFEKFLNAEEPVSF